MKNNRAFSLSNYFKPILMSFSKKKKHLMENIKDSENCIDKDVQTYASPMYMG